MPSNRAAGSSKKQNKSNKSNKNNMTSSIIKKWKKQGGFIRFFDGNIQNCAVRNLGGVSMKDAMDHVEDWAVDWDVHLTPRERALVMTPEWRAGLIFN